MEVFMTEVGRILGFMVGVLSKVWPFLLVSIPLAVAVRLSPAGDWLKKHLGTRPVVGILMGTLLGAVSPLCSCTVIPVVWSLLTAGVPLGAVMSFWIASPSMDPEIFFLSVATLGWPLALWRLGSTALLALGAGFLTHGLVKTGFFASGILRDKPVLKTQSFTGMLRGLFRKKKSPPVPCCTPSRDFSAPGSAVPVYDLRTGLSRPGTASLSKPAPEGCGCGVPPKVPLSQRILKESEEALWFVGKFMLLAYFIEALIVLYLPAAWVQGVLGGEGLFSVLAATLVGIPLYTTNIAALGMLGGLVEKGMSGGAVLAFLIAGPTTTLPAMSAVFGIAKPRVFLVYLGVALVGAVLFGALFLGFSPLGH